jgi:biopolymer transport protein ExbB
MFNKIWFLIIAIFIFAEAAPDKLALEKEQQLSSLRAMLQDAQDSLQNEIASRWRARQRTVEQRETDKEEIDRVSELLQKSSNELSSVTEERYGADRRLEDAKKQLELKLQQWTHIKTVVNDVLQKEADVVTDGFPLDIENESVQINKVKEKFLRDENSIAAVVALTDIEMTSVKIGNIVQLQSASVLPDGASLKEMHIARFGNVFGYGIDSDGFVYSIKQSGREGVHRYNIIKVENPVLSSEIVSCFGIWIKDGRISGNVPMDILQNENSEILSTGKTESLVVKIKQFVIAGGPVMIPICLLPLWALILILLKCVQFTGRRRRNTRSFKKIEKFLENGDRQGALVYISKQKNPVAGVAKVCLHQKDGSRKNAEESVKALLMKEIPTLGTHLSTLAVIAAVAPLLGLLGTVTGMISLFEVITKFGTGDPKLLAGGISEALITTEAGLAIAIPVLLIHNFFRNVKNRIGSELQLHALSIINRIFPEA